MQQPEIVEDENLMTTRLKVPGGWIYRSFDKSAGVLGMCFVPESQQRSGLDHSIEYKPEVIHAFGEFIVLEVTSDTFMVYSDDRNYFFGVAESLKGACDKIKEVIKTRERVKIEPTCDR